jgi:hypothetical protein
MSSRKVFYQTVALDANGQVVYIQDALSGLACNCICAECGRRLVAKRGEIKIHHFAHEAKSDCVGGAMTALHRAAQDLLLQEKVFTVPAYGASARYVSEFTGQPYTKEVNVSPRAVSLDDVRDEVVMRSELDGAGIEKIIPDIILYAGGRQLIVEIFVTHRSTPEKISWLKKHNRSAVEIDLSGFIGTEFTREELRQEVVFSVQNKVWLFNSLLASVQQEAEDEVRKIAHYADIKMFANHRERRSLVDGAEKAYLSFQHFHGPDAIDLTSEAMIENGRKAYDWLQFERRFGAEWDWHPDFVGIGMETGRNFKVHEQVWQAGVILEMLNKRGWIYDEAELITKIVRKYGRSAEFEVLWVNPIIITPKERVSLPNSRFPVREYLDFLKSRGLAYSSNWGYNVGKIFPAKVLASGDSDYVEKDQPA